MSSAPSKSSGFSVGIHEFVCIQFKGAANQSHTQFLGQGIFPLVVSYNMLRVGKSVRQSQEHLATQPINPGASRDHLL